PRACGAPLRVSFPAPMTVGILLALGASVCWALANVAIQQAGRAVGPVRALLWAQLVGMAGVAIFSAWLDRRVPTDLGPLVGWAALSGTPGLLASSTLFYAFERAPLSLAVPVMSSWSLIAAAFSIGLLGERIRTGQGIGAALVVGGVILVSLRR